MSEDSKPNEHGKEVLAKFERRGRMAGTVLGLFVGIVISGPFFFKWSFGMTAAVIIGFTVVGGFIGYCADHIALGSTAGGFGAGGGFFGFGQDHGGGSDSGVGGNDCGGYGGDC
jgi:hypothetical protein